jgi:hypothetical protein
MPEALFLARCEKSDISIKFDMGSVVTAGNNQQCGLYAVFVADVSIYALNAML